MNTEELKALRAFVSASLFATAKLIENHPEMEMDADQLMFAKNTSLLLRDLFTGELAGVVTLAVLHNTPSVETGYIQNTDSKQMFELVGRLSAAHNRLGREAYEMEETEDGHEDDNEDHTGHGCSKDPALVGKSPSHKSN